jgi:hypothetical protein
VVHGPQSADTLASGRDTEEVDRQRAEAHLRLLVEEELRRPAWRWGERRLRVGRVALLLTAMGALDDESADRILEDFNLALVARQPDAPGRRGAAAVSWRRAPVRSRPAMPVSSQSPASGPTLGRLVPLGQVIPLRAEPAGGEVYLLSYAQTEAGAQLSLFMRPTRQDGMSGPEAGILEQFTAADDRWAHYQMSLRDVGGGTEGWTLVLKPSPPYDPLFLDLVTAPGQPAVRVDLDRSARPPQDAAVTADPASPGDRLLHAVAARLLARAGPSGFPLRDGAPGQLAPGYEGFGDVIALLLGAGALSPLSPVPGQFAALCERLHLTGHGITALPASDLPARDLPEPWLSMLEHYHGGQAGTAPVADAHAHAGAAAVVALPELDGLTLAILGLQNCRGRTVLHMHASGPMSQVNYTPAAALYYWPLTWIMDNGGRWHATRLLGQSGSADGTALRVEVVPPLSRATTGIEVVATGRSAEARARLPLRWA